MFCKNCGANLPEGTTFCGSCGSKQDAPAPNPVPPVNNGGYNPQPKPGYSAQLNLNNFAFAGVSGMRLIGVIAMALVAIFSITEYMYMEAMGYEKTFNFMALFENGFPGDGTPAGYNIFMYLIVLSNIVALAGCAGYIAFTFMGGPAANSPMAIQKCVLCATVALIAFGVGIIACFICPSPVPEEAKEFMGNSYDISLGYKFQGWLSLAVVAAVRFYVLPICAKEAANN